MFDVVEVILSITILGNAQFSLTSCLLECILLTIIWPIKYLTSY